MDELIKTLRYCADETWPFAEAVSNLGKPGTDNNHGRAATTMREAADALEAAQAREAMLVAALRKADCAFRIDDDDGTVGGCVDAGHCGCVFGAALTDDGARVAAVLKAAEEYRRAFDADPMDVATAKLTALFAALAALQEAGDAD